MTATHHDSGTDTTTDASGSDIDLRDGSGGSRRPPGKPSRARRPIETTLEDRWTLLGSAVSALCLNWLILYRFTTGASLFGFLLCSYATFLVLYAVVTSDRLGRLVATDRIMTVVVLTAAIVVFIPLVFLIGYILNEGRKALRFDFFVHDQTGVDPTKAASAGGGAHAIIGTIEQVGLALIWSLPLALAAAVFLNESRSKWRRPVRIFVDAMSGLPSIIAGLFIYAALILNFGESGGLFGFNGFMASLALAITMLPTITRTCEVVLRLVPDGLREASLALGSSRARTVWSVVFPTAKSGMSTAVVLGIARAVGETAPLLFTAFGYDYMNANPFSGPQDSLPLFVYKNIRKPDLASISRGFTGAMVLMVLVLVLFVVARFIGRDRSKRTSAPRRRRPRPPRAPTR